MSVDLTSDYLSIDGLLQGLVLSRAGTIQQQKVNNVQRSTISVREAARSNGVYTTRDVKLILPQKEVNTWIPKLRDTITVGSEQLITIAVTLDRMSGVYVCLCRNFIIEYLLQDLVDIEVANQSTVDTTGAASEQWVVLYPRQIARVQPLDQDLEINADTRRLTVTHEIFLLADLPLTTAHRIRFCGGVYSIKQVKNRQTLTSLMSVVTLKEPLVGQS
jgi:hypothetical protein